MTAKEALDKHPTATEAHVNEKGEWLFCKKEAIHESFGKYDTIYKNVVKQDAEEKEEIKSTKKNKK